ncbi:choice-of-anchor X domain-containing protein, partial [Bacteroidota bacterium]
STGGVPTFTSTGVSRILHTAMTADVGIFDNFVKPILAEPPGNTTGKDDVIPTLEYFDRPVAAKDQLSEHPQYVRTGTYDVLQGVALEIPIEVPDATSFGVTYLTPSVVTSTLFDPSGMPVDTVEAGSDQAEAALRAHNVESPAAGTWKLTLEQADVDTVRALVSVWAIGASLELSVDVGDVNADDHVKVTAILTDAAAPAPGATVEALALGEPMGVSFPLFDDGAHGDGAADDGVYAAWFRPRQDGTYLVSVTATKDGEERIAVVTTEVENVTPTSTERVSAEVPSEHRLDQNYPNPFNPSTTIRFAVSKRQHVTLEVFTVSGKLAAGLVDKEVEPGEYAVTFDAMGLPSGTYFYRMRAGAFQSVKRLTLLK